MSPASGTLEPLSRDYTRSNHDARLAAAPPRRCQPRTAIPANAAPRRALLQLLQRYRARRDGTPSCLPLYLVRATVNGPLEPAQSRSGQPLRLYPRSRSCSGTGRATTLRLEQDSPGRPPTLRRCSPYRNTCRNSVACMLTALSLAYKRRGSPQPRGIDTGRRTTVTRMLSAFPTILAPASIKPLGLGGHASSPASLVATPLRAPRCKQYSAPSTPLLDVRPRPEPG
jgi:hypothetical protein